jgi:hypothetical protein
MHAICSLMLVNECCGQSSQLAALLDACILPGMQDRQAPALLAN